MANIVNTSLLGWIDLDHVSRVTEIKQDTDRHSQFFYCNVYVLMRNKPFRAFSEEFYEDEPQEKIDEIHKKFEESFRAFILMWHKGKKSD
jgi:hypothetical protein